MSFVPFQYTLCGEPVRRCSVTIPINTSITATIRSLIYDACSYDGAIRWYKILGVLSDGSTQRPAIRIASKRHGATSMVETDFTTHGEYVAIGAEYMSSPSDAAGDDGIRSADGSTITVTIAYCA